MQKIHSIKLGMNAVTMNKTEFARFCNVSRSTVMTAIKKGRITVNEEGKVDIDVPNNVSFRVAKPRQRKEQRDAFNNTEKAKQNADKKISQLNNMSIEDLEETSIPDSFDGFTRNDIDKYKIIEQIKQIKIKTRTMRGDLIDRSLVKNIFSKLYAIDQGQLKAISDKLAPAIATIYRVDDPKLTMKVNKLIDKEIHKALKSIQRLLDDFLETIEPEKF